MAHRPMLLLIIPALMLLLGCEDTEPSTTTRRYEFREDKTGHLIRLDNSTGEATIADDEGMRQIFPPRDTGKQKVLIPEELSKVTGNGACSQFSQSFAGRLYNGVTGLVLRTVAITINNKKALGGELVWTRQFMVRDLYIRPSEVKGFVVPVNGLDSSDCTWTVEYAEGSPWPPSAGWWEELTK